MRALIFAADVAAALVLIGAVASAQDAATTPKSEHNQQGEDTLKTLDIVINNGHFTNDSGRDTEATIGNIVEYARQKYGMNIVLSPGVAGFEKYRMNIVLSPGVAGVVVKDVTVRDADIESFFQALTVATEMRINARQMSHGLWAVMGRSSSPRRVEVFNVSGYLQHQVGPRGTGGKAVEASLDEVKQIIVQTLSDLKQGQLSPEEQPSFQFHSGANMFIVIGTDQALDVAGKVVNALPGQRLTPRPDTAAFAPPGLPGPEPPREPGGPPGTPGPDAPPAKPRPPANPRL